MESFSNFDLKFEQINTSHPLTDALRDPEYKLYFTQWNIFRCNISVKSTALSSAGKDNILAAPDSILRFLPTSFLLVILKTHYYKKIVIERGVS